MKKLISEVFIHDTHLFLKVHVYTMYDDYIWIGQQEKNALIVLFIRAQSTKILKEFICKDH